MDVGTLDTRVVRLARRARLELFFAAPERECELDCRLLFLGGRQGALESAYAEIARLFEACRDPDQLTAHLLASSALRPFYEARRTVAGVAVNLRDSVYRGSLASVDLELTLRVERSGRRVTRTLPASRLGAVGQLWPRLLGDHRAADVGPLLEAALPAADAGWAMDLFRWLQKCGAVEHTRPARGRFHGPLRDSRVTFLGHSSLLVQSPRSSIVFDPLLRTELDQPRSTFDVCRLPLGAICCSHGHWDHFNPQTLLWFDKRVPVIVPRVHRPSVFNPPMATVLALLGFTDIREVDCRERIAIGDIELETLPFYGEQDEPDEEIDHFTYVARAPGLTVFGGVDSFRDTFGDTKDQCEEIRERFRPDVAFLPVSRMVYHIKWGGPSAFRRRVDTGTVDGVFQYTAGPEDAAEWAARLRAPRVVPYATFTLTRATESREAGEFWRALRRLDLGGRFCPLPPLGTLGGADVRDTIAARWRRLSWLARFCAIRALSAVSQRPGVTRGVRRLRGALRRFVADPVGATRTLRRRLAA